MRLLVSGVDDDVDEHEYFHVTIELVKTNDDGTADFSVRFGIDREGARGVHQRPVFGFPITQYNKLALLKIALDTLEPSELELEHPTAAPDLARRQRGVGPALPREEDDPVDHNGPAVWGG